MTGFRQAVGLLTRLPVENTTGFDRAAAWFPAVGALVGSVVAGTYVILFPWLPSVLAAGIAVGVGVWLTGAFHEDGLGDTFDAFGGASTVEEALRIMRDPGLGTYGTIAVTLSMLLRIVAVGSLSPGAAVAGIVLGHTLGRANAVAVMATTPPARIDGLGASGVAAVSASAAGWAIISGLALSAAAAGWWVGPAVLLTVLASAIARRVAVRRIGGVTGDILGACEQVTEIVALVVIAGATWRGWSPWWAG
jgi:adenosylcobinamide-GDP ribazoletransferase